MTAVIKFGLFYYINCIERIMADEMVLIHIPETKSKLSIHFPEDPKGDIIINFKESTYNLQKAFLRLYSNYFKTHIVFNSNTLNINVNFDEDIVQNVLSCFYGCSMEIQRCDIIQYFKVVKFFQIGSLEQLLRNDIIKNCQHYNVFQVFGLAFQFHETKLFSLCMELLQKNNYEQIKTHRKSLLESCPELFKHIIKCYNHRDSKNINFYQISALIVDYCQLNELGEQEARTYKFDLIDKQKLSSEAFKKIFINNQHPKKRRRSPEKYLTNSIEKKNDERMFEMGYQIQYQEEEPEDNAEEQTDRFDQHGQKNQLLIKIREIKETYSRQLSKSQSICSEFHSLRKNLSQKEAEERNINRMHKNLEYKIQDFQRKLSQKSQKLNELISKVNMLTGSVKIPEKEKDRMLMSVVNDSFYPKIEEEVEIRVTKKNNTATQKQSNTEVNEIKFDRKPITIQSKEEMKYFVKIISPDFFSSKKLSLVYRRSQKNQQFGDKNDLRNKNQLVVLFRTTKNKVVGGFVSQPIPSKTKDPIEDGDSFIFSLTYGKKFRIKPSQKFEAISQSDDYLICFSSDLMIAQNCLNEESYCEWPTSYQRNKQIKERGSEWLVGDTYFSIQDLQCFEMEDCEVEMIL